MWVFHICYLKDCIMHENAVHMKLHQRIIGAVLYKDLFVSNLTYSWRGVFLDNLDVPISVTMKTDSCLSWFRLRMFFSMCERQIRCVELCLKGYIMFVLFDAVLYRCQYFIWCAVSRMKDMWLKAAITIPLIREI